MNVCVCIYIYIYPPSPVSHLSPYALSSELQHVFSVTSVWALGCSRTGGLETQMFSSFTVSPGRGTCHYRHSGYVYPSDCIFKPYQITSYPSDTPSFHKCCCLYLQHSPYAIPTHSSVFILNGSFPGRPNIVLKYFKSPWMQTIWGKRSWSNKDKVRLNEIIDRIKMRFVKRKVGNYSWKVWT